MIASVTWALARASGLLAWVLLAVSALWGLLAASRLLERRPSPAWLLSIHRHLGGLTIALTALHLGALWMDDFVDFGLTDLVVPFASDHERSGVAFGVLALWLLLLVDVFARLRGHFAPALWRAVHWLSFPLLVAATVHGLMVGTDRGHALVVVVGLVLLAEIVLVGWFRARHGRRTSAASSAA